jgi:hypothetical protein
MPASSPLAARSFSFRQAVPPPRDEDGETFQRGELGTRTFKGPLFVDGVSPLDPQQGTLNDCVFAAWMGALAHRMPELLESAISSNSDGTFSVRYLGWDDVEFDRRINLVKTVTVDPTFYQAPSGSPLYGRGLVGSDGTDMELWFPVIEKAFAAVNEGYERLEFEQFRVDPAQALLGLLNPLGDPFPRPKSYYKMAQRGTLDDALELTRWVVASGFPAVVGFQTKPELERHGLLEDHSYTLLDFEERSDGAYVLLRNPHGRRDPVHGVNDGQLWMKFTDFYRLAREFYYYELDEGWRYRLPAALPESDALDEWTSSAR